MKLEIENLKKKYNLYLQESQEYKDSYGWNSRVKCDGLLFNCLWAVAGANIDIMSAREPDGKWHRHPAFDCYQKGQSKSEISRDMFDGLFLWILKFKRSDVIIDLIRYGEKNDWIMGHGDISRTYFTPSMQATAYEIRYFLTGKSSWKRKIPRDWYRPIPFCIPASITGFQRHLQILHIYTNSLLRKPSEREIELLNYHVKVQPLNALYDAILHSMTDNDFASSYYMLMNTVMFPNDSLPTTHNYDSDYLWQRDDSSNDWKPNDRIPVRELPGIDWLFAASIILGGKNV